jgi:hypothetical protein
MRLRPALGSAKMINALSNPYVLEIVSILEQTIDLEFFRDVAFFLRKYTSSTQESFDIALSDLSTSDFPDLNASFVSPGYVIKAVNALRTLYKYDEDNLRFLRGAIVEKLTFQLISQRCLNGECFSNHYFEDMHGRSVTGQIDVAVYSFNSEARCFVEGYECKMSPEGLQSEDCDNLRALTRVALEEECYVYTGVVSFEKDRYIYRRLQHFDAPSYIEVYGLDSLVELKDIPPYISPNDDIRRWRNNRR